MQTNIGLGGKTVIAGLNWSVIAKAGPGRKKSVKKACEDSGLALGVLVEGEANAAVGLCSKKSEFPSGAAMLAAAHSAFIKERAFGDTQTGVNWILVEKIQGGDKAGMYWLCAIQEGLPIPGGDLIEELTVTTAKLAELVELLENVEIFSIEPEILEYVAGASPSDNKGFVELTTSVVSSKSLRPQKLIGVPDWIYWGIVGIVVLVLLIMGFSYYTEQQAAEEKQRKAATLKQQSILSEQQEIQRRSREYQDEDKRARNAEMQRIAIALSISPKAILRAWSQAVNALPINHGGWDMESVSCSLSSCVITLVRDEAVGTAASLMRIVPQVQFSEAGGASYSVPVIVEGRRDVALGSLANWSSFALTVGTSLQQMKMSGIVEASLGSRRDITYVPPAISAGPAGGVTSAKNALNSAVGNPTEGTAAPQPPKALGYLTGTVQLRGSSLWQIDHVGDYVNSNEFTISTLKVDIGRTLSSDSAWNVQGAYYLQSEGGVPRSGNGPQDSGRLPPGFGPTPPENQRLPVAPAGVR